MFNAGLTARDRARVRREIERAVHLAFGGGVERDRAEANVPLDAHTASFAEAAAELSQA